MRGEGRSGDGGFTLLETLVAFVIAALALGALYRGAGVGLRSAQVAVHTEAALSRARSRLAVFDDPALLKPGHGEGDDGGGFAWQTDVTQTASAPFAGADTAVRGPTLVLYAVRTTISWTSDGGRRAVSLATARLGVLAPAPP